MYNSTIKRKKCKCGCDKYPSISYDGWYSTHAPDEIKEKVGTKHKAVQKAKNERLRIASKLRLIPKNIEGVEKVAEDKKEMDKWFIERSKELTGICANCGGKTCKGDPKYWKYSICHILEKKNFHSVKTHPLNFVELCHFGNSCHANLDNKILEMQNIKCWSEIQLRFEKMYPSISKDEQRFIPDVLLESL